MTTLVMPILPAFRLSRWGPRANTQVHESPLTRSVDTLGLTGTRWRGTFTLPPMKRVQAANWQAFLVSLDGRAGRFYGYDPDARTPRGTWAGAPLVNGGSQGGVSLVCDGFSAGATVKRGDYFMVNGELKMVTADGTADGSGNLTIAFGPSLRAAPADNDALTSSNPVCTMMLAEDDQGWDANEISIYGISFDAIEVF